MLQCYLHYYKNETIQYHYSIKFHETSRSSNTDCPLLAKHAYSENDAHYTRLTHSSYKQEHNANHSQAAHYISHMKLKDFYEFSRTN